MSKSVTILRHQTNEGAAEMHRVLLDLGFDTCINSVPRQGVQPQAFDADLLMVMGGSIGVYQDEYYPFLRDEVDVVKRRLDAGKAVIGICLGAQILAKAMGADVYPGTAGVECGWAPLNVNEAGRDNPVRHFDASKTNMFHWHGDTFDLPKGTVLMGSTDQYENQIFSAGPNILGLQCHPEVQKEQLEEWFVGLSAELTGPNKIADLHDMRRETAAHIDTLNAQCRAFFKEWLAGAGLCEEVKA